jgi:uncharacterized protein YsxB (DUF464 family)
MPTAIEKIQAKAKALRKSYPNAKWTDLIKKASTDLKKIGAIGGVSKKKKATKKAATKKTVSKRKPKIVKVLKQHGTSAKAYDKRHQALPAGRRISKSGRPYTETRSNRSDKGVLLGLHKDTKSHNVRISVMSGLNKTTLDKIDWYLHHIALNEQMIEKLKNIITNTKSKELKVESKKTIINLKSINADYKKMITTLKKHIK